MSTKNQISQTMFNALTHKYNSELLTAKSSILVYFNNSVVIGEHSNLLKEISEWTQRLAEAEENISILNKHFVE